MLHHLYIYNLEFGDFTHRNGLYTRQVNLEPPPQGSTPVRPFIALFSPILPTLFARESPHFYCSSSEHHRNGRHFSLSSTFQNVFLHWRMHYEAAVMATKTDQRFLHPRWIRDRPFLRTISRGTPFGHVDLYSNMLHCHWISLWGRQTPKCDFVR